MTFVGALVGAATSILTTWIAQRYALTTQLALKQADSESAIFAALRAEKERRYLAVVQNIDSLFMQTEDSARKQELLKIVRELWLLGDQHLVRKLRLFFVDIAGTKEVHSRERLFADVVLDMRKDLGIPSEELSDEDFRFHRA